MSKLTLSASVAALLMAAPALAADMNVGGNCCADLEERIAELEATTARKGNRKMSLTVYGQVNKAILWTRTPFGDDDHNIVDNPNSQSRIGFTGTANINADWSAGFVIEIGVSENWGTGSGVLDLGTFTTRHSAVWLENKQIGRVSLGHTSQATDGIAEITVANTDVASTMLSLEPISGVYLAWLSPNNLPFDGGRTQVVRWDSPSLSGFKASASWSDGEVWDAALRYAGEFGGFRVAAGVGYRDADGASETITGSASVMHVTSGLFVNAAAGHFDGDLTFTAFGVPWWSDTFDVDVKAYHVQGGIEQKLFSVGKTTFYGEYMEVRVNDLLGDDPSMYGLGVVQAIDPAAMDLYAAWRRYDVLGEEIDTFMGGARVKF